MDMETISWKRAGLFAVAILRWDIYADVNNLFTITPYDGLDVETDDSYWAYPNVRSFSIGLDITF